MPKNPSLSVGKKRKNGEKWQKNLTKNAKKWKKTLKILPKKFRIFSHTLLRPVPPPRKYTFFDPKKKYKSIFMVFEPKKKYIILMIIKDIK